MIVPHQISSHINNHHEFCQFRHLKRPWTITYPPGTAICTVSDTRNKHQRKHEHHTEQQITAKLFPIGSVNLQNNAAKQGSQRQENQLLEKKVKWLMHLLVGDNNGSRRHH